MDTRSRGSMHFFANSILKEFMIYRTWTPKYVFVCARVFEDLGLDMVLKFLILKKALLLNYLGLQG